MIRNLKTLGLMVVAAMAMSAMVASAAQAQAGTFTAGETPSTHKAVEIHGAQYGATNYFEAFGEKITCENSGVTFTGTDSDGTATSLKINPTYKDCNAEGRPATVSTNGCEYSFTQPETVEPLGEGTYTGNADLTCPKGNSINIEVFQFGSVTSHSFKVCTITVSAEGEEVGGHILDPLGGSVHYQNGTSNGKDDVTVSASVNGIQTSKSGLCGSSATEGEYVSTVTVTGKEDNKDTAPLDVWISDEGE